MNERHESRFALEISNRILKIGPDFFEEIYYPIGGVSALLSHYSSKEMTKNLQKTRKNIDRAILMMKMLHYAASDLQKGDLPRRASKKLILDAADRLGTDPNKGGTGPKREKIGRGIRERTSGPLWSEYEPSMLLLYAAHHVRVKPRPGLKYGTFLEAILSKNIWFQHDITLINEIIARASYLKTVFARGIAEETMKLLSTFKMPLVSPIETNRTEFEFMGSKVDELTIKNAILSQ